MPPSHLVSTRYAGTRGACLPHIWSLLDMQALEGSLLPSHLVSTRYAGTRGSLSPSHLVFTRYAGTRGGLPPSHLVSTRYAGTRGSLPPSHRNNDQQTLDQADSILLLNAIIIIIIYHDFLPTPRRGSHVKSGKTHTQSSRYTP